MRYIFVLFAGYWLSAAAVSAQQPGYQFRPGFDAQECDDLLRLNFAFLDTTPGNRFDQFLPGHRFVYRSASVGLDNV